MGCARRTAWRAATVARRGLPLIGIGTHHCQHKHGCEHDARRHCDLQLHAEARGHLDGLHGVHSATNAAGNGCLRTSGFWLPSRAKWLMFPPLRAVTTFPEGSGIALEGLRVPGSRTREVRTVPGCLLVCYSPLADYRPARLYYCSQLSSCARFTTSGGVKTTPVAVAAHREKRSRRR